MLHPLLHVSSEMSATEFHDADSLITLLYVNQHFICLSIYLQGLHLFSQVTIPPKKCTTGPQTYNYCRIAMVMGSNFRHLATNMCFQQLQCPRVM